MTWLKRNAFYIGIAVVLIVIFATNVMSAPSAARHVDWAAVRADIIEGWPPAEVNYIPSEEFLEIIVAPGTSETAGRRIACDIANPAIKAAGGDPDDVTVAVFEEGSDETLAVGGGC